MATDFNIDLNELYDKTFKELGTANVIVTGKTGVGKSTLINSVFRSNIAATGKGKPVTYCIKEYTKEGVPLQIIDTKGIEIGNYKEVSKELIDYVKSRKTADPKEHVNVAWYCINYGSNRIEEMEVEFIKKLSDAGLSVVIVFTQSYADSLEFLNEVKNQLYSSNVQYVKVVAMPFMFNSSCSIPASGLDTLVQLTLELLPECQRNAFAAAQKVEMKSKVEAAERVIRLAAAAAATAAFTPIPVADAALLAPIQVGMLAGITHCMGLEFNKGFLTALISSALGVVGATYTGRAIFTGLLKLIPGSGTIIGGAIAATTASTVTALLGKAYLSALERMIQNNESLDPESVSAAFVSQLKLIKGI